MTVLKAHEVLNIESPASDDVEDENFMGKVFACINAITETGEELDLDEQWLSKAIFIIIKAISFYPDCTPLCNEASKLTKFGPKIQYDFLFTVIEKKKRIKKKWPKRIDDDRLPLIQKHYNFNRLRAHEAMHILTEKQVNSIVKKMNKLGGVE